MLDWLVRRKRFRFLGASRLNSVDNKYCTGASGKLTIVVFAPDSSLDRVIRSRIEACELVTFDAGRIVATGGAEMITLVNLTGEARGQSCRISNSVPSNVSLSNG